LQNYFKSIDPNYPNEYNITLEKSMRLKIIVERDKILEHGFTLLNDAVTSKFFGFLEFEYKGEIGNGLGPTLEFFNLIFEKMKEDKSLWYKTTDGSWYPNIGLNENELGIKTFKLLGYIIGRAIYDDRLIDIPLSRVFWNLILERPVLFEDIKQIDNNLFKVLNDLKNLINQKKILLEKEPNLSGEEIEKKILYNNSELSSLDIYFTFPGYDIELKKDGAKILLNMGNVEEYVNLIYDFLLYRGVSRVITAFREGFCLICGVYNLKCFTSSEIEEFICGSLEIKWDENTLYENIKPEHGYSKTSRIFDDLIKFMCKLDKFGQRQFLIFTTGTPRLPIGGFKALSPKLTIVKKTFEKGDNPDNYLPTVMTCQNYLKLPEYSSYEIFEKKMILAMKEGGREFNLS
jgi:E3 ubiquitin-protein ligase TRIP12